MQAVSARSFTGGQGSMHGARMSVTRERQDFTGCPHRMVC